MRELATGIAVVVLAGCIDGADPQPDAGTANRLTINAAMGIELVQSPSADHAAVDGLVLVQLNGENASGATVELNGAALPEAPLLAGFYDVSQAQVSGAAPGAPLTLKATAGGVSVSLDFECPPDVVLSAPAEDAATRAGETVTLSWTGKIDYNDVFPQASARIDSWDSATNVITPAFAEGNTNQKTAPAGQSVDLKVPATSGDGWVAQLSVPGVYKSQDDSAAVCTLVRRAHLRQRQGQ